MIKKIILIVGIIVFSGVCFAVIDVTFNNEKGVKESETYIIEESDSTGVEIKEDGYFKDYIEDVNIEETEVEDIEEIDIEEISPIDDLNIIEYNFSTIEDKNSPVMYKKFLLSLKENIKKGYYPYGYSTMSFEDDKGLYYYVVIGPDIVFKVYFYNDYDVVFYEMGLSEKEIGYLVSDNYIQNEFNNDISGLTSFLGYDSYDYVEEYLDENCVRYQLIDFVTLDDNTIEFFINTNMGMLKGTYLFDSDSVLIETVMLTESDVFKYVIDKEL